LDKAFKIIKGIVTMDYLSSRNGREEEYRIGEG
jgi:hypothetical protein